MEVTEGYGGVLALELVGAIVEELVIGLCLHWGQANSNRVLG